MSDNIEILAHLRPWSKDVDLAIISQRGDVFSSAEPVIMKNRDPGVIVEPALSLCPKAVQALMDDLWKCGYRPSEGTGSAGQLSATEKHLEDMRTLVFK